MSRSKAKPLTLAGVACVLTAIILIVVNLIGRSDFPIFISPLLFVGGIVLIISSLAYYTEK